MEGYSHFRISCAELGHDLDGQVVVSHCCQTLHSGEVLALSQTVVSVQDSTFLNILDHDIVIRVLEVSGDGKAAREDNCHLNAFCLFEYVASGI